MREIHIGDRIAYLRIMSGMTYNELAKRVKISPKAIKNLEAGISKPSVSTITKLCKIYHVSADYLLCIKEDETVSLHGLNMNDQQIIRAMIQAYIRVKEQCI